jgi:hypothetical protein
MRVSSRLAAASAALLAAAVASLLIAGLPHTRPEQAVPVPAGFPSPPNGAMVFARQDSAHVLALALNSKDQRLSLQASVVGPDGLGVAGLPLEFAISPGAGRVVRTRGAACGPGCYAATATAAAPRRVSVTIGRGAEPRRFEFVLPHAWPHTDAGALVRRSGRVWRNLKTLVWRERLASDSRHAIRTVYRVVAPDRLSYQVAGGAAAVVIGHRRWDRDAPTGSWQRSAQQPPVRQPAPFWSAIRNAHIVATPTVRGHRAWRITFFDPRTPAWFTVVLDRQSLRTLDLQMVTTAHFMHDVYGPFNEPLRLRPPT